MSRSVPLTPSKAYAILGLPSPASRAQDPDDRSGGGGSDSPQIRSPTPAQRDIIVPSNPILPTRVSQISSGIIKRTILRKSQIEHDFKKEQRRYIRESLDRVRKFISSVYALPEKHPLTETTYTELSFIKVCKDHPERQKRINENISHFNKDIDHLRVEYTIIERLVQNNGRLNENQYKEIQLYMLNIKQYIEVFSNSWVEFPGTPHRNLLLLATYFVYSHTVLYRNNSLFNMHFIDFPIIQGVIAPIHTKSIIQGHHPIFRSGGTHHLVFIDDIQEYKDSYLSLCASFDVLANQIECEKDFDTERTAPG